MGLFDSGYETPNYKKAIKPLLRAQEFSRGQLETTQAQASPYLGAGSAATGQLQSQLGLGGGPAFDVTTLPGYQAALEQGLGAVNQGAAGAGMLMSGERLKGLQRAGQDVFGQYYNTYMDRLMGLSGQGQRTVMGLGGLGQQAAVLQMQGAQGIANLRAQQANQEAAASRGKFGDMLNLAATGAGYAFGGPLGGSMGSTLMGGGAPADGSFRVQETLAMGDPMFDVGTMRLE